MGISLRGRGSETLSRFVILFPRVSRVRRADVATLGYGSNTVGVNTRA